MYSVSIRNIEKVAVPRMKPADVRTGHGLGAEDAEAHQRLGVTPLPEDEADEQDGRQRDDADRPSASPSRTCRSA